MQEKIFLLSRLIPPWRFAPPLRGRPGFLAKEGSTPQLTNTKPSQRSENGVSSIWQIKNRQIIYKVSFLFDKLGQFVIIKDTL